MSAIHRIDDAGEMEAAVFFSLISRLPAYDGVLAARIRAETQDDEPAPRRPAASASASNGYRKNRPSTADTAPAATGAQLAALNAQLGSEWFSHAKVPAGGDPGHG
jgi:hypothetical protein